MGEVHVLHSSALSEGMDFVIANPLQKSQVNQLFLFIPALLRASPIFPEMTACLLVWVPFT